MKMKYLLLLAAAMFTFGAPVADAAPKKSKKAKTSKKAKASDFDFSVKTADDYENARASKAEKARLAAEEAIDTRTAEERREENEFLKDETKFYISRQKKTVKILKGVRNEKSAAKAAAALEELYGAAEEEVSEGDVTALGTVVKLEEDENKIPVHQASRSIAAALNGTINQEMKRISNLGIENKKFNAALVNMVEQQRN
jgi:hypothetical protein